VKINKIFWMLFLLATSGWGAPSLFAAGTEKEWYVTPKVGYSGFTGIFGLEVQHHELAFDIGLPTSGGIRYYFRPQGHSWFAGLYGSGTGYDHDETKNGITYTRYSKIEGGVGGGYRWFWHSRWSLELGLTVSYLEEHWTSNFAWRTEKSISFGPILTAGFSF
jgi:hypothetical protein